MRRFIAALLATALCLGLAGCAPAPESEATPTPTPSATPAPEAAEFALACYPEAGFHPITGGNRTNLALCGLMYEGLFELDEQFQPQNQLCASYAVSADGLNWIFTLESGVSFSDGSPLTAAEVVSSLELARTSALYAARFTDVATVSSTDSGAVSVTLSRANGALPALLDIPIVKETGGVPLGTGPYVLTGAGNSLTLTANTRWRQGADTLPRQAIPLRSIQEADDLIHAFDTRDIALVATDLTGTNALGFSGSFATVDYPTSTMLYVGFNTASGPCRSAEVRQALLRCFDRATVSTVLLSRHAQAAALPVSPAGPLYNEALAQSLEFSLQAVEEQLTAAGWTRGGDGWTQGRERLSLTFVVPADNSLRLAAAEQLAANLTDAGIQVDFQSLSWDAYLQALTAGNFDLYLGEVRLTADFDLTALITPGGALNYGGYSDAQAVTLLTTFRTASGAARETASRQLCAYLAQQPPFAVICFKNWSVLTQWSQISGLTPTQSNVFHQFADWEIS